MSSRGFESSHPSPDAAGPLTPAIFADRLNESFRLFWLIAMGVVRDSALAEDIVQEAAVVALGKLEDFQPGSNFAAWMGQTVRYVALNQFRKERRRRGASLDQEDSPDVPARESQPVMSIGPGGRLSADQQQFDDGVMRALDGLSEPARACLLLRSIEGLEYSEISALLGIPEGTAMSHVHRARAYLRDRLSGGVTAGESEGRP